MADTRLDELLWRWAAWCVNGTSCRREVTSWLRERKTGTRVNAAFEFDGDCVEYRIEVAVAKLAAENALAAKVLRTEYNARAGARLTQADRAIMLGVALRTYKLRLKQARDFVAAVLYANAK